MKVDVLEIQDMGKGCLRAYATVQVGPLIIYKVRLIKQPMQKPYVCPPQFEWLAPDNRVRYTPVLKWPDEWKAAIFSAVWDAYCAQRGTQETDDTAAGLFAGAN